MLKTGTGVATGLLPGATAVVFTAAGYAEPGSKLEAFNAAFTKYAGHAPESTYEVNGYEIGLILDQAVKTGGSVDPNVLLAPKVFLLGQTPGQGQSLKEETRPQPGDDAFAIRGQIVGIHSQRFGDRSNLRHAFSSDSGLKRDYSRITALFAMW